MNSTVNPEAQVADRVASLMGTTLTEADVHRFLLDAADILGTESFAVYGPDLFFRWACGDRYVEITPNPAFSDEGCSLRVISFDRERAIDIDEYLTFENCELNEFPYVWTAELGRTGFNTFGPGTHYAVTWEMFDEIIAVILHALPDNLALIPPQWRRPLTLRWDMGAPGLGLVSFTGTVEGLTVTVESTGEQVLIPRALLGHEVKMGDVVAGLAGGRPLMDIRFAGSEGFGDAYYQDLYVATPNGNESGWDKDLVESLIQEHEEGRPRAAMTMEDLRQLAATPASTPSEATVDEPEQSQTRWTTVPMKIGLSIPAVLHVVEQVLDGAAIKSVLKRLGGRPSIRACCPILRGDGWLAERSPFTRIWSIEVVTEPKGKSRRFDDRHVADYAWRIAQALEQRYGPPYGMNTTNDGYLSRLFRVGNHGIEVGTGFAAVTVETGSFDKLAEFW
ncbi:hypothetical protein BKH30_08605 [Actinomyces oris]|uniref:Uncharacterized protein n=1 Tax=Actinomyces oris TaxID=544580 RepID=A0A1Q8VTJ8_9ACTO|nr:hypothetical protein BKH30_08605 [Actinomyces oris]